MVNLPPRPGKRFTYGNCWVTKICEDEICPQDFPSEKRRETLEMTFQGIRAAVFVSGGFEDPELKEPVRFLRDHGAEVVLVGVRGKDKEAVTGKRGSVVRADKLIGEVRAKEFDLLVIPGGQAPDHLRTVPEILAFTREMYRKGKPVAAICHGPQILISANLARGRRVTGFPSIKDDLLNAGADHVDKPVVVDGNLITSRRPEDIPQFNDAIRQILETRLAA
jgi:protease I